MNALRVKKSNAAMEAVSFSSFSKMIFDFQSYIFENFDNATSGVNVNDGDKM